MPTELPTRNVRTRTRASTDPTMLAAACAVLIVMVPTAFERALLATEPERLSLRGTFAAEGSAIMGEICFSVFTTPTP
jgi:hypothetical protein